MTERCKRMSERTSKRPNTYVSILGCSEPLPASPTRVWELFLIQEEIKIRTRIIFYTFIFLRAHARSSLMNWLVSTESTALHLTAIFFLFSKMIISILVTAAKERDTEYTYDIWAPKMRLPRDENETKNVVDNKTEGKPHGTVGQKRTKHRKNSHLISHFPTSLGVSKRESCASEQPNGRGSGPVLQSKFLINLDHSIL